MNTAVATSLRDRLDEALPTDIQVFIAQEPVTGQIGIVLFRPSTLRSPCYEVILTQLSEAELVLRTLTLLHGQGRN